MTLTLLIAATGAAAFSYIEVREHRAAIAARRGLLDDCSAALDRSALTHGEAGFPKLAGSHRGRGVQVELLLDTMTIRRLPQLWLSTTLLDRHPGLPGLALLLRHCGTEFYSLTSHFPRRLDTPCELPEGVLIRGDAGADRLLAALTPVLAEILDDPRVKEIAITERGLRIVRQAAEGKRGEHLLLRQSTFENARVPSADLAGILAQLHAMRDIIGAHRRAHAA